MKMVVAGTGSIGQRHIQNLRELRPDCTFVFLRADGREDVLSIELSAPVVSNLEQAMAYTPDALLLATPSNLHAQLLIPAIEAGLPMYVEKPVVTLADEVAAVCHAIAEQGYTAPTLVGCNLRFLPSLQKLHELVEGGAIGRVVRGWFEAGQWLPEWRPGQDHRQSYSADPSRGGGVVLDLVHEIDAARWLLGDMAEVQAFLANADVLEINSESVATVIMRSNEGTLISLALDYIARQPLRRYQLVGEQGTLIWDLSGRSLLLETPQGREAIDCGALGFDVDATYSSAMAEFLAALEERRPSSLPLEEGLNSTELAIRIKEQAC